MSKRIKQLIENETKAKLDGLESVAVLNPQGISGNKTNELRRMLSGKGLKMTVVRNSLAARAVKGSAIEGFTSLLDGPSALVYGKAEIGVIARLLVDEAKKNDKLQLRGIFFDGDVFTGPKGVEQVRKFPTREEAIADVLSCVLSPARNIAAILDQGGVVASLIEAVEKKAESGTEAAPEPAA